VSRASGTRGPELGPFLEQLEQLLAGCTGEQLREILLAHAARLPTAERAGFLAIFEHSASGTPASAGAVDPTLVADITGFIDNVENGVYADGYGFDRDYGDYRTFGDETWTIEFDALAQRAGEALLAGDAATARQAYQLLLEALGREYDEGGLPGAGLPTELVDTDLAEAKHRYLRAVWEDEPVAGRAGAVLAAAKETAFVGGDARLAALEATRREALPDLDPVLPDLIAGLRAVPSGFGFGTQARRLLAECTQRYQGVDGLARLARAAPGDEQAEAYRDWVDALAGAGRLDDAYAAAVEALDRLDGHGGTVAALGRRLAALAAARGEDEVVLAAGRTVWRADPTLTSLLELLDVATALGRHAEILSGEAGQCGSGVLAQRPALAAAVMLLAGRVEDATALLGAEDHLYGWDRHPATVVIPFLLVAASSAHQHPQWRYLLLFEQMDRANLAGRRHGDYHPESDHALRALDEAVSAGSAGQRYHGIDRDHLLLSSLLVGTLDTPPSPARRRRWLETARGYVDARVDLVVGGQHRPGYRDVAHLAAGYAEALWLTRDQEAARESIDGLHARYRNHSSFRRELRTHVSRSSLLADDGR
jgi:hypothetical protein